MIGVFGRGLASRPWPLNRARGQGYPRTVSFKLVYLTGAPAAGKSTVAREVALRVSPVQLFDYGDQLRLHVAARGEVVSYDELRARSASVVSTDDVARVDDALLSWAAHNRQTSHLIVDTHAVTRESYGFRVTGFRADQVLALAPDLIVVLYASPSTTIARISTRSGGRLPVDPFEAGFHAALQGSVAVSYGIQVGCPVYFLDTSGSTDTAVAEIERRLVT